MAIGHGSRRLAAGAWRAASWLLGRGAVALSLIERGSTIVSIEPGADARIGRRVVVFCHFDKQGCIRDHTRGYVDALRGEGLDVVFVSNSAELAPADLAWLRARAARIVVRRNVGYDFAAWRDAMTACALPGPDTSLLLLANDSVYGPLRPLAPVLQRIDFDRADVWGATDSWQHRFHLQSYFVAFGPKALASTAFARFWSGVRNVRSKAWVVSRYEVGLTRACIAGGLRCRALWSYADTIARILEARQARGLGARQARGAVAVDGRSPFAEAIDRNVERIVDAALRHAPVNPAADLWLALIEQGFPFLKRELLRDNPSRVPDVAAWPYVLGTIPTFDRDVILRDLERVAKNRSP